MSRQGIYNTSISILRLNMSQGDNGIDPSDGIANEGVITEPPSVSGRLFQFASIRHLVNRKDVVKENADMLEQHGPKLVKESHIGASGLSASAMKKAGQSVVEVHRGDNYQFAYFLKPAESYDMLIKARDFVAVTTRPDESPTPTERTPTPEPPKPKRGKLAKKRAPKSKSRPRISSAAKKRKRKVIDDDEEDAEMSDAWSDLDENTNGGEGGEEEDVAPTPSEAAPTRRSARQKNLPPVHDVDERIDHGETTTTTPPQEVPQVVVKSEPDEASALASLLPISGEDGTPAPQSQSPNPPLNHIIIDEEEEKPKQELHLTYSGYVIPSRCLCVIAEPWPALPTTAQLVSETTKQRRRKPASPKPAPRSRPLFRADSDDEGEEDRSVSSPRSPEPEFDSDDEQGKLKMFSQMLNKVVGRRSGVATRGGMEEFEDDALYGDADEEGRGV
ncbi:hypothetical protein FRC10_007482 [Ceratobasidium sp. 414]|nr:hypothetical protein FRC10_007482 [Ceratobasidium sp. 414]